MQTSKQTELSMWLLQSSWNLLHYLRSLSVKVEYNRLITVGYNRADSILSSMNNIHSYIHKFVIIKVTIISVQVT